MLRFLCCRCFSSDSSSNETQPLLYTAPSSQVNGAESARKTRPGSSEEETARRMGRLTMRRVNVSDLDRRFIEMAETFNKQQEHYEAMLGHIRNLQREFNITNADNLSFAACLRMIRKEKEGTHRISLKMKGYDFSLSFAPVGAVSEDEEEPLPPNMLRAQKEVGGISENAKAAISKGTTLQELIGWLIRSHNQMVEHVKEATETYQERGRLIKNLEENMKEVKRAKELSQEYRNQAGNILIEAADIAGTHL